MRRASCLALAALAVILAAGCVGSLLGPSPAQQAAEASRTVGRVRLSFGWGAHFEVWADGRMQGEHLSGDPARPFLHRDEGRLDPKVLDEIMNLATKVYRSPAPSEPDDGSPRYSTICITLRDGQAKYYPRRQNVPYADPALQRLHELLLKHHIGGW